MQLMFEILNIYCNSNIDLVFKICDKVESRISGKGVHMCKGVGVRFADFIYFIIKYPIKMK